MFAFKRAGSRLCCLIAIFGIESRSSADDPASPKLRDSVELGMPESLFRGVPKVFRSGSTDSFLKLMKDSTGIKGNLHPFDDAMLLAKDLDAGKVHLALFQGHEFAWAKAKYPDLMPIVVAVPLQPMQAFCLVRWDCPAKNIGELTKEKISLPPIHRDVCEMFLAKQKAEFQKVEFAGQLDAPTATDAIFDVIERKSGCTIVDGNTLKLFESLHPGPYKNLRILSQSQVFPDACIAVKKNALDENTIDKIRKALLNVQNLPDGNLLLTNWKLKSFSKVPDNYEQGFKEFQKGYPAPLVAVAGNLETSPKPSVKRKRAE